MEFAARMADPSSAVVSSSLLGLKVLTGENHNIYWRNSVLSDKLEG